MFGGSGTTTTPTFGYLNDVWRFDATSSLWTWMGGTRNIDDAGFFGTLGVASASNLAPARVLAAVWRDPSGAVWMFGGYNGRGALSDLWKITVDP